MPRSPRRWPLLTVGGILLVLVLAAVAWAGYRSAQAHDHLAKARDRVPLLQQHLLAGDTAAADADVRVIQAEAARARAISDSVVLRTIRSLPYLGRTTSTAQGLAVAADDLAAGPLPSLVDAAEALSPQRLRDEDSIELDALRGAAQPLSDATLQIDSVRRRLVGLASGSLVIDPVDHARTEFLRDVTELQGAVTVGARFAAVAPGMLGEVETRRYFVGVQDNSTARATGGLVRAYAILEARAGRIRLVDVGSAARLQDAPRPVVDFGSGYVDAYGRSATRTWAASNVSAHFPYVAETWARLWNRANPARPVDAVLTLDPRAYAGILRATGPVQVTRRLQLNDRNVVAVTEVQAAQARRARAREGAMAVATGAILRTVLNGGGDTGRLGRELGVAARERHLAVWSDRPGEQEVLAQTDYAGMVPETTQPYLHVVVNNLQGSRLDFYARRSLTYFAAGCDGDRRQSSVVFRLSNDAPRGLSDVVTATPPGAPYAQNRVRISVYTSADAELDDASIDTTPVRLERHVVRGHPVFSTTTRVERNSTVTLRLALTEPVTTGPALVVAQPLAFAPESVVDVEECG